jgi:cytochrome c oxidase assembly protein subunit 15
MNGLYSPNDVSFKEYFYLKSFSNPSIIQFYHRIIGYTIIIYILFLNYRYFKNNLEFKSLIFFNAAVLLQIALGVMALLSGVEIKYASPHQIGSILVISSYLFIFYKNYSN